VQRRDGSHRGITLSKTERHKQPYEVEPRTRSHVRTASSLPPFRGNVGRRASETSPCRRAGNAKRRARPPKGDGERPGRRRGNRDPRALWVAWLPPRRL